MRVLVGAAFITGHSTVQYRFGFTFAGLYLAHQARVVEFDFHQHIVDRARQAEEIFHARCLTPTTGTAIRSLAELSPTTLAVMHGSSFNGDSPRALRDLADLYDGWFRQNA